jgi:hypothetical protein
VAKRKPTEAISEESRRKWHRLLGLLLTDHLAGSPFTVELEKDLSQKQQLLDVVVIRRGPGEVTRPLPDGLDDLVAHNLITFKSHQDTLDDWSLKELTGHYVNYRKQVSPRGGLLAEDQFRLIAICARHPRQLFDMIPPEQAKSGVFTIRRGSDAIRIIVVIDLAKTERNAFLHLFSAAPDQIEYGAAHCMLPSSETSRIINRLFEEYRREGLSMPYTMEDFRREVALEYIGRLTPEERMAGLPPEQRMAGVPPEQRVAGLAPEQRMAGMSAEEIEAYLRRLRKGSPASRKKKPRPKQ